MELVKLILSLKSLFVRYGLVNEIISVNGAQFVYGLVKEIISDNGAQFMSREFEQFLQYNGIRHSKCALYHSQSNPVERFNRVLNEGIKAELANNVLFKDAVYHILANYRSTIHCTFGVSQASFMFGREMVMPLDVLSPNLSNSDVIVDEEESAHKMKTKSEYRKFFL